jgi:c-di-GMP-binding flagellar brake protein YcgR
MNVLISHLQIERGLLANFALQLHDVNISACGMAFRHDEAIRPGDHLLVELQLLPHDTRLHLLAESVASEADNGAYFIRLNFIDVPGDDQELLIQHIVRCQSRMLGKNRLP